jgi:thiol-disulfide isomerase/thioredoxin
MLHALLLSLLSLAPAQVPQGVVSFRLPSLRGDAFVSSEDFGGKVVYVEVARTNCARCAAEAPDVRELRRRYQARGLEVITVYDELPGPDDPFVRALADANKKQYEHPLAMNDGSEFHGLFYSSIKGTPSAFLISRNGQMINLGIDALAEGNRGKTILKIESLLSEAADRVIQKPSRAKLEPFSLLSYGGGVLRSTDFAGRPTVLVAWIPGPLMTRLGPALELVQQKMGAQARILAVTFADFDAAVEAGQRACPSVMLAAPDARAHAVLDAARLPQILFIDTNGKIAKRLSTLYGAAGIEASVIEKITTILVRETAGDTALDSLPDVVRDELSGMKFKLPPGFAPASAAPGSRTEFVRNNVQLRSRLHEGDSTPDSLRKVRETLGQSHRDYRVKSEERLPNGAVLLADEWQDGGRSCRALRLFVNTSKGIVELQLNGPLDELDNYCNDFRSTAESVIVDR